MSILIMPLGTRLEDAIATAVKEKNGLKFHAV
jgi:hypothetical protein